MDRTGETPYLSGCIHESVQLSYPTSHRSQRQYVKPLQYRNWVIPPRAAVGMNMLDMLTNRWIDPSLNAHGHTPERYVVCFGKDAHSCLGVNLAWCELYLVIVAAAAAFCIFTFELFDTDVSNVTFKRLQGR